MSGAASSTSSELARSVPEGSFCCRDRSGRDDDGADDDVRRMDDNNDSVTRRAFSRTEGRLQQ